MGRGWYILPPAVGRALRPHIEMLVEETTESIRSEFPDAEQFPKVFWDNNSLSVTRSVEGFVDSIETGRPKIDRRVFEHIGALQARAGHDIEETLSAFRLGGAAAWRRVAALGVAAGIPSEVLFEVAESLFVYIDELSAICARAYSDRRAEFAGATEARRMHLVRLLLAEPVTERATLGMTADAVGCRLDQSFAVLAAPNECRGDLFPMLPSYVLPGPPEQELCAVVPDADAPGRRRELAVAVERVGVIAGLGPSVGHESLVHSLRYARAALRLAQAGAVLGDGSLVIADDHTPALLISGDRELADRLVDDRLEPFASLTGGSRLRMEMTLQAWLRCQGSLKAMAAEMGVHPKTAKYRLDRLRDLFDGALDSPDARFELELALRVRDLVGSRNALPSADRAHRQGDRERVDSRI